MSFHISARRRHNGSKKDFRIEALEAKVNQLLHSSGSSVASLVSQEPSYHQGQTGRTSPACFTTTQTSDSTAVEAAYPGSDGSVSNTILAQPHSSARDVVDAGFLTLEAANALLENFKTTMTPHFPFVLIAPHMTAEKLRWEKPFLFLTILAAASYENMQLQSSLGKEVKQAISTRMIFGGEMSFELLQGLLVHLAWCQYHSRPRQYTQFLQLAVSIIVDLRLDRRPQVRSWKTGVGMELENHATTSSANSSWGRDEQRAVAGCFYLSSSISMILEKLATFPHSAYIEDCCKSLREDPEYPTDKYLLYIVQIQHILEKIDHLSNQHDTRLFQHNSAVQFYVMSLKSELEVLRGHMPFAMNESHLLVMQFHTVELYLYQICLLERYGSTSTTPPIPWSPWRLEILCAGLIAAKSLLGYYLSLPLRTEMAFNNSEWVQLGFALTVASKLSIAATDEAVCWETTNLRSSLGMSSILKQSVFRMGALTTSRVDAHGERDVFYHFEQRSKRVQRWFESHFLTEPGTVSDHSNDYLGEEASPSNGQYLPTSHPSSGFQHVAAHVPNMNETSLSNTPIDGIMDDWMSCLMAPY
ncbi:MAG: hypothetical protein M1837_002687 [Sclerophora amabilis]|nr:MAG: hypothetical protein M1837_002687 [Sclerophora amabilis]